MQKQTTPKLLTMKYTCYSDRSVDLSNTLEGPKDLIITDKDYNQYQVYSKLFEIYMPFTICVEKVAPTTQQPIPNIPPIPKYKYNFGAIFLELITTVYIGKTFTRDLSYIKIVELLDDISVYRIKVPQSPLTHKLMDSIRLIDNCTEEEAILLFEYGFVSSKHFHKLSEVKIVSIARKKYIILLPEFLAIMNSSGDDRAYLAYFVAMLVSLHQKLHCCDKQLILKCENRPQLDFFLVYSFMYCITLGILDSECLCFFQNMYLFTIIRTNRQNFDISKVNLLNLSECLAAMYKVVTTPKKRKETEQEGDIQPSKLSKVVEDITPIDN